MKAAFTQKIIEWHVVYNKRIMPWKGEKDPYKIWLSEIILQQTRVEQGLTYYENFIMMYPVIEKLAFADDEAVFKLWEGLGYYNRCKNLLYTARKIVQDFNGRFPERYDDILKLKGIGPYTAAAIASFAYGAPYAVVDGNVLRVLSRYFGEDIAIDTLKGKKHYEKLAQELLHLPDTSLYNQAIMDFGATVCKPQLPECKSCILNNRCIAYKNGLTNKLPVKEKQLVKKQRWIYYFVFSADDEVLVNKRAKNDIWENLYEFYFVETQNAQNWKPAFIRKWLNEQLGIVTFKVRNVSPILKQQLTHQHIKGQFITIDLKSVPASLQTFKRCKTSELSQLAFPKFINQYLQLQDSFLTSKAILIHV